MRFSKNKTIDKNVQEQINKEKDHWKIVLLRIIVVVNNLGKNNLAFQEIMKRFIKKMMEFF
jgi:hypothetical protein